MTKPASVKLEDIVFESGIYPREQHSTATVNQYVDGLRAGNVFPPIVLEEKTNRLLDGKHRWEAHKKYLVEYAGSNGQAVAEKWAVASDTIECVFARIPDGVPAKLFCARFSAIHGDRLTAAEKKAIAREIYTANPDYSQEKVAECLGVSQPTVSGYVKDILARKTEERASIIARLSLLGWTQEEIGEAVGCSQDNASLLLRGLSKPIELVKTDLSKGLDCSTVAERHALYLPYVWALKLDGLEDEKRMNGLEVKIQPYDVWNFGACDDLYGQDHPGRIPGQLLLHVLYFFTKPNDVVIDPMAGGGTTQDACLVMGRRCYGYDADNRHKRPDIITHDLSVGWPERTKKADLVFWDPPYFDKKDKEYSEASVSRLSRAEYLAFFGKSFTTLHEIVKKGTRLAFLMSDWNDNEGKSDGVYLWDYSALLAKAGWTLTRHIQCPLGTQQVHPDIVNKFRASKKLARLGRWLLVAHK